MLMLCGVSQWFKNYMKKCVVPSGDGGNLCVYVCKRHGCEGRHKFSNNKHYYKGFLVEEINKLAHNLGNIF